MKRILLGILIFIVTVAALPPSGYTVEGQLGNVHIPGVGDRPAVRIIWEGGHLYAYCGDPELFPNERVRQAPPDGRSCDYKSATNSFWCGDDFQEMIPYDINYHPTDTPTPTVTATATFTSTPTATATSTPTETLVPTATATGTLVPTNTAVPTQEATETREPTRKPQPSKTPEVVITTTRTGTLNPIVYVVPGGLVLLVVYFFRKKKTI